MNGITDEKIGLMVINFLKGVADFNRAFFYGLKEVISILFGLFTGKKAEKKEIWSLILFSVVLLVSTLLFHLADEIVRILPEPKLGMTKHLITPFNIKALGILILILYIKSKGDRKISFMRSFDKKFEAIGLHSRLVKEKIDAEGKKVKVKDFPKLLKIIEDKDKQKTIFLFTSNGITISDWKRKLPQLETVFDKGILEITNTESKKAVKIVTVPYDVKEELTKFNEKFEKAGLYTKIDGFKEFPKLYKTQEEGKKMIYYFISEGVPLSKWKDRKEELESVFDANILSMEYTKKSKRIIELVTVPAEFNIEDYYPWKDEYIPEKDFEVTLGEGLLERITLDFNSTPHLLIAGLTGSGKSVLERCITWQVIKKGASVFLVDFKGGVELDAFKDFSEIIFERKRFLQLLDSLVKEHNARISKFKEIGVKNIIEYNNRVDEDKRLSRVFLIVDEIAEILDSSGVSKNEKTLYEEIEGKMSTLARLSRATGINMILATQRPDAKVIKGQIKNNLGARVSGRMTDKEPSIMALGSPDAMKLPEKVKGRFLFSLGAEPVEFQGYYLKDSDIKKGNYEKGIMLVTDSKKAEIKDNVEIIEEDYYEDKFEDDLPGYWDNDDSELSEEITKNEGSPWTIMEE